MFPCGANFVEDLRFLLRPGRDFVLDVLLRVLPQRVLVLFNLQGGFQRFMQFDYTRIVTATNGGHPFFVRVQHDGGGNVFGSHVLARQIVGNGRPRLKLHFSGSNTAAQRLDMALVRRESLLDGGFGHVVIVSWGC